MRRCTQERRLQGCCRGGGRGFRGLSSLRPASSLVGMRGTNGFRFGGGSTTAFSGLSRFSRFSRREDGRWKMERGAEGR